MFVLFIVLSFMQSQDSGFDLAIYSKTQKPRKRFSEKPIVAFTNSIVFILDLYKTK